MANTSLTGNLIHGFKSRLSRWQNRSASKLNLGLWRRTWYKHIVPNKWRTHPFLGRELTYVRATEMMHGLEEIFGEEIYKQSFGPRPYIIDCGANIGLSVLYLKTISPDARVLAFEPDEENFRLLERNIQVYGLASVKAEKKAVWIREEILNFSGGGSMASRITGEKEPDSISVNAVRLRDFLLEPVDFLKIDIEGAEYAVVKDIADQLPLVKNFFLEYHGSFQQNPQLTEIIGLVESKGFNYYIKEAAPVYPYPFDRKSAKRDFDVQLNIFFFRAAGTRIA